MFEIVYNSNGGYTSPWDGAPKPETVDAQRYSPDGTGYFNFYRDNHEGPVKTVAAFMIKSITLIADGVKEVSAPKAVAVPVQPKPEAPHITEEVIEELKDLVDAVSKISVPVTNPDPFQVTPIVSSSTESEPLPVTLDSTNPAEPITIDYKADRPATPARLREAGGSGKKYPKKSK